MNRKKGNSLIVTPIVVTISIIGVLLIGMILVNVIKPFVWQQKLNKISNKYMFVIEKYGYLTSKEKDNMLSELSNSGFNINDIFINVPTSGKSYGELINFKIEYKTYYESIKFYDGKISIEKKPITINVNKNSYSKI